MKPDFQKYRQYVDALNLTEEQKVELIGSVWRLVEGFVDRAFGHDSYAFLSASEAKIASEGDKLIELEPQPLADTLGTAKRGETQNT